MVEEMTMKKLVMMFTLAGFMSAGLVVNNSFAQGDPNQRKTKTEEPQGTAKSQKDKKDGTVKEKEKSPFGTTEKKKTDAEGSVKKDKTKEKSNY